RLQRGVNTRDLEVPVEGDVVLRTASDGHRRALTRELTDALTALLVAVDQERLASPLGRQALLQFGRTRRMRRNWGLHCGITLSRCQADCNQTARRKLSGLKASSGVGSQPSGRSIQGSRMEAE